MSIPTWGYGPGENVATWGHGTIVEYMKKAIWRGAEQAEYLARRVSGKIRVYGSTKYHKIASVIVEASILKKIRGSVIIKALNGEFILYILDFLDAEDEP